jgi:hypothetical protein
LNQWHRGFTRFALTDLSWFSDDIWHMDFTRFESHRSPLFLDLSIFWEFINRLIGHIIMEDLNIIYWANDRTILAKDSQYRDPQSINWKHIFSLFINSQKMDKSRKRGDRWLSKRVKSICHMSSEIQILHYNVANMTIFEYIIVARTIRRLSFDVLNAEVVQYTSII